MHNLNLNYFKEYKLSVNDIQDLQISPLKSDRLYCCLDKCIKIVNHAGIVEKLIEFQDEIIGFEYLSMNDEICIATKDGSVHIYNVANDKREEVTFCDGGLAAMKFSLDQEIVVFVTKNVVILNSNYDVVNEVNLYDTGFGDKEFITVGWGNEETQFQGSEGKQATLKKKIDELGEADTQGKIDDTKIYISWREDCEFFTISFIGSNGRMFKVFNKEGVLHFTSEHCLALQSCIAWRPSGNWIAMPEVYRNKYVITLFEKNGLKHREIVLPFNMDTEPVINISWSTDSEILLIHTKKIITKCQNLYLYTVNNYHWYLKQTLKFESDLVKTVWSPKRSDKKTLYVVLTNGSLYVYQWEHTVNHSLGNTEDDQGVVSVIDGKKLLISAFRTTVVPPPMCNYTLMHDTEINFVQFIDPDNGSNPNLFLIVDTNNDIYLYECVFSNEQVSRLQQVKLKRKHRFKTNETIPLKLHHFLWISETKIVFTTDQLLYVATLNFDSSEANVCEALELKNGNLGALVSKNCTLFGQNLKGQVSEFKFEKQYTEIERFSIEELTQKIKVSKTNDIILLKPKQNLYWNKNCLASDVTSFTLVDDFLMYTTLDELKFVNLKVQNTERKIIGVRKLERGSKIIHVVAKSSKVILQLPRGNLETIHPRLLSLCIIRDYLNLKAYKKAFDLMRRERINLNLFVDHEPTTFVSHINEFIHDIENIQWINLFLSELQNIDVTQDMYSYYHNDENVLKSPDDKYKNNKVGFICQKIIEYLEKGNDAKYCLPLITCYVKKGEIENSLQLIWNLKLKEENSFSSTITSEEAFKYLLYLVNVNELYNIALGLYNFPLVLYVAKRTQKDPKEYVQFLQELDELEENYRFYKIDCFIKRYDKAIENISKCGANKLQEAIQLIEKHQLYIKAINCYKKDEECYSTVCKLFADYLRQKNKLLDASLMYEKAGDLSSAISCARNVMDWKRCIRLAKKNNCSGDEFEKICLSLINTLQANSRANEAANIAKYYLKNVSITIEILMEGQLYNEAIYEASEQKENIFETKIADHLKFYLEKLSTSITEDYNLFLKHKTRLLEVRKEKQRDQCENQNNLEDDIDLYSDTSSMNSSRYTTSSKETSKTSRSSKNRRKHERKLLNLKEGNKYEDLAIIDSLHKLIIKVYSTEQQSHVRNILIAAVNLDLDKEAFEIQQAYKKLMTLIKKSLDEIWLTEMIVLDDQQINSYSSYDHIKKSQHYSLLQAHLRYKPVLNAMDFELEVLNR